MNPPDQKRFSYEAQPDAVTRRLTAGDLTDMATGAAILGAGGGGDPYLGRMLAEQALAASGGVDLVPLHQVPDDAVVAPVAIMGAPTVIVEKPPAGDEYRRLLDALQGALGKQITHIACFEAGGLNSMCPLVAAAQTGLPIIDGDGMGRAFPELQMVLMALDGVPVSPMVMTDEKSNTVVLRTVSNHWAERLARPATVEMGCAATIALYPMTGAQARTGLVPGTLSLADDLGKLVRSCRAEHRPAPPALAAAMGGAVLAEGKVTDVERRTVAGFARGMARLQGLGVYAGRRFSLAFQNEHLVASEDERVLCSVPDLICVLDADSGDPVTTERLRYGSRVVVVGLPCHERWRTVEGLALVGPGYFGYDHPYVPVEAAALAGTAT